MKKIISFKWLFTAMFVLFVSIVSSRTETGLHGIAKVYASPVYDDMAWNSVYHALKAHKNAITVHTSSKLPDDFIQYYTVDGNSSLHLSDYYYYENVDHYSWTEMKRNGGYDYCFTFYYRYDDAKYKQYESKIKRLVNKLNIRNRTTKEKIKKINNYMVTI